VSETWPAETIPVLGVADAEVAAQWYAQLGFTVEWVHRFEPRYPAFVSIALEGVGTRIFLSEHAGDARSGAVWLRVEDIGPAAAALGVEPTREGARLEIAVDDPDGNRITIGALGDPSAHPADEYDYTLG
jgi:catechol 2,3-dioxygenase-like lactoylglutathione lyase family enzyme